MLETLLQMLFVGACWIKFVEFATQEGNILYSFQEFYFDWCGDTPFTRYWAKPLFLCPMCMASLHGFWVFAFMQPFHGFKLWLVLPYCMLLSGFMYLIDQITPGGFLIAETDETYDPEDTQK